MIIIFNTVTRLQSELFDKISSKGTNSIRLFCFQNIDQIQKKVDQLNQLHQFAETKVNLVVFVGEFPNLNSDQIKDTNFTIFDFIQSIRSLVFSCVHFDVPTFINSDQRSKMIDNLINFNRHFCISINRSQDNDISSTLGFLISVDEGNDPSKAILSFSQKFLVTFSSSITSEPISSISSISSDEGLTFSQSYNYPILTQKIVITEESLGLSDDELSTFDSIIFISDTQSIVNLMNLPWENNLKSDSNTILHITVHLPFINDGHTTYLELSNKSRIPMKFFEDLQNKANTKRCSTSEAIRSSGSVGSVGSINETKVRLFFPLIKSLNQKELKNEQVFVLNVKKHQRTVQQILFSSMWATWAKAIEQIHPKFYNQSAGEKIRLLNQLYEQNQAGVMCFTNLYSIVSDFRTDSLIPFHTSNHVVCEIYQDSPKKRTLSDILNDQDRVNSFVLPVHPLPSIDSTNTKATKRMKIEPFIKIEPKVLETPKVEHKRPKKQKIDDFFKQIKNTQSLSIKLK